MKMEKTPCGRHEGGADDQGARMCTKVRIPLSRTGDETVELGYNGKMYLIKRGQTVRLEAPLVEILEHAGLI